MHAAGNLTDDRNDPPDPALASNDTSRAARLREIATLFTRLGFTAFGGPAVHIAMMEDELVRRRRWLDRRHFLDLVAALNFIPGPNSTELAIHLGLIRAGMPGLLLAGACFILPAVLIILPIAWAYVHLGRDVPQVQGVLAGISAAVIAILLVAFWRFARTGVKDAFTLVIGIASTVAAFVMTERQVWQPELVILAIAAVAGAVWYGRSRIPDSLPLLSALPLAALTDDGAVGDRLTRLFLLFLKIGATLFGSGYVLVSYLRINFVEQHGWLTERELLDAVAVGQVTPGPVLTTATFIGYVLGHRFSSSALGGVAGAVLATVAIFLPAFVLVALLGRVLPRIRQNRYARGALDSMNAAVAALLLVVTVQLGRSSLTDPFTIAICLATLAAILIWNLNTTWLILGAALAGLMRHLIAAGI